ncbi:MAG: ABC transporter permease [Bacteroidetes bacterium]|nr:ABC transporter permease [Bacteroidota bacterium]
MIKNYFKTAWRNLLKNKTFSAINIFGLSLGITTFLLIINYLRFEYSYDDYNINKDRIYRVPMVETEKGGKPQTFAFTFPAVAPALKKDYPEIEQAVRFRKVWGVVTQGDQKIIEDGQIYFVDPAVFKIFTFNFEKGTSETAFAELNDAVITHSTEKKYFGNESGIGKKLHYGNEDYVVKAVLKDIPSNSHIQFHILLNFNKYIALTNGNANTSWGWSDFYTYILLKPGADIKGLQAKMPAFAQRYRGDDMKKTGFTLSFDLEKLKDIHTLSTYDYELAGNGNLYYLKYLGIAALFILFIALINYINLSTARSLERSKEVGLRKVVGATKFQLVRQFLAESMLVNIFAILIGYALFKVTLPQFATLIDQNVLDMQATGWKFWALTIGIFLLSTLLAGFYPAFVLSSFQPIQTLKSGKGFSGMATNKNFLRKSLVVLQFTAAVILIGGAIGFYRQLQFMSNRDLGINIKQTFVLKQPLKMDSSNLAAVESVINDMKKIPGVQTVTASTEIPGNEVGGSSGFRLINSYDDKRCRTFGIDENFIPNYGLTVVAGRNFGEDKPVNEHDTGAVINIILNETAAKVFGFKKPADAINQLVEGAGHHCKIIGVMNDYHQQSLQNNFDPIVYYREQHIYMGNFALKLNTPNISQTVDRAKTIWHAAFPQSPLRFFFLSDHFNEQYKDDNLFATILGLFTVLAIIVASLGLFGLSLYTVAKRTKEISIRKVLGASALQITTLITKDYVKLILVACLIAIPVAYFLLQNWLKDYAFHIEIGYWFFFLPFLLIVAIALITVSYQSIKAALTNPAKSLRSE